MNDPEEETIHALEAVSGIDGPFESPAAPAALLVESDAPLPEATPAPDAAYEDLWAREALGWLHPKRQNVNPQKISALTLAIVFHILVLGLLGFVIVAMPRPEPPLFVAAVAPLTNEDTLDEVRIQKINRSQATTSTAKPAFAISAAGVGRVSIPAFDHTKSLDVTATVMSYDMGMEMSFASEGAESVINFFGIKSKSKRIAFVIDAEKYMLTDNKGGIPAYTRVKNEIGEMLAGLNRDTAFNLLIYEGKRLATYRDELVAATPSNVRLAIEWLAPLNAEYNLETLGIRGQQYNSTQVKEGVKPILFSDISGYPKAIQACLEMDVHTVFIIASGFRHLNRTPTEKEKAEMQQAREKGWDEKKQAAWAAAQRKAQDWLRRENEARKKKGVAPKVITSLWPIMRMVSPGVVAPPNFRGYSMEEVEDHVKDGISRYYRAAGKPRPSVNLVWFIGEDESPSQRVEEHFKNLTRLNRGKLKILKGLAAVENVTGGG